MKGIVEIVSGTNLPTIILLSGLALIFLSFAGRFGTYIEIREERQNMAAIVGAMFFIVGIGLHYSSGTAQNSAHSNLDTGSGAQDVTRNSTYWIVAGSFKSQLVANNRVEQLRLIDTQAISVNTDDYGFLRNGYIAVLVPVPN